MRKATTSFLLEDAVYARANRGDCFQAGLDHLAENSIPGKFGGKRFRFHWNINLYIDMHSACNAKCPFCINRVNFPRQDIPDEIFLNNLEKAVQLTRFATPSIQIVGGEPTLRPARLLAILDLIRRYRMRKPAITTNGSGMVPLLDNLDSAIEHVNISRHHMDDTQHNSVMGFENPLNHSTLVEILMNHPLGTKIRLNCCLLKGHIDSFRQIIDYIDWGIGIGARNICFSTLSHLPDNYIYPRSFVEQSRSFQVGFNSIMAEVDADKRFEFQKFHTGSHCMYEIWEYRKEHRRATIVFATSNNRFAQALDEVEDLIELMVFHSNGVLAGSWNRDCKVLCE